MERPLGKVLIVEDDIADIRNAAATLKKLGVTDIEAVNNVAAAIVRLQTALEDQALPFLILLDLDFARESGFEVLRFWKSHAEMKNVHVVVWTSMSQTEIELSRYFGVEVVSKGPGARELMDALQKYFPQTGHHSAGS
jgi:CheY-like chemotaxis protein